MRYMLVEYLGRVLVHVFFFQHVFILVVLETEGRRHGRGEEKRPSPHPTRKENLFSLLKES